MLLTLAPASPVAGRVDWLAHQQQINRKRKDRSGIVFEIECRVPAANYFPDIIAIANLQATHMFVQVKAILAYTDDESWSLRRKKRQSLELGRSP